MIRAAGLAAFFIAVSGAVPALPDIHSALVAREAPMYAKYRGFSSVRESFIREYDSRSGAFICSKQTVVKRRDYFYAFPEADVVSYRKDGKEMPPREYTENLIDPAFPFCDARAAENYIITPGPDENAGAIPCSTLIVKPRKKTARHFDGKVYLAKKGGGIVLIDGTLASLPLGLSSFHARLSFTKTPGGTVPTGGIFEYTVHIPLIFPHRRVVTEYTSKEVQLIN